MIMMDLGINTLDIYIYVICIARFFANFYSRCLFLQSEIRVIFVYKAASTEMTQAGPD